MKLIEALGLEDDDLTINGGAQPQLASGIMDERDVDFLNHLEVPIIDDVAMEGIVGAIVKEVPDFFHAAGTEMKGWVKDMESKRKYINDSADSVIDWLKNKDKSNPKLDLDMGNFKTWMKTSELYLWRYFFVLNNEMWTKIKKDLKEGKITDLEISMNVDLTKRTDTAKDLDSVTEIKGLIKIVETYKQRSNEFFDLIVKRKVKVKMAPFQVLLLGLVDLRTTVKKIVNLAL